MPGVLKNAIDHASRPHGQSVWAGKPAGVMGGSIGAVGTAVSQQHLRNTLIHARDGFFDDQGDIARADARTFLKGYVDRFVEWVKKHS
jgi:chromate reductase